MDHHLTLHALAAACGVAPDELRPCGALSTFHRSTQSPLSNASIPPALSSKQAPPLSDSFPGAEILDSDQILRISHIIIGKGTHTSLSHLQLPSPLFTLARHSGLPESQAASILGEKVCPFVSSSTIRELWLISHSSRFSTI